MWEGWGADARTSAAPDNYMIVAVSVDVRVLTRLGRTNQWPPCTGCPRCGGKTWGHGWVDRIFEGISDPVKVPRRRCPGCKAVTTLRPQSYRSRFRTATAQIIEILRHRLRERAWPVPALRQRFGHWLRRFHDWLRMTGPTRSPLTALMEDLQGLWLG